MNFPFVYALSCTQAAGYQRSAQVQIQREEEQTASKPQHFVSLGLSDKEEKKKTLYSDLKETEFPQNIHLDAQATSADYKFTFKQLL